MRFIEIKKRLLTQSFFGGGWWIRTTEVSDNRFTVCPLWPLGKSPIWSPLRALFGGLFWSWWSESNQQPADYKSAALPLSHTSELFLCERYSLSQREYYITGDCVCQAFFEKIFFISFLLFIYSSIITWQSSCCMLYCCGKKLYDWKILCHIAKQQSSKWSGVFYEKQTKQASRNWNSTWAPL